MKVMGIDPGTNIVGWAVLEFDDNVIADTWSGVIDVRRDGTMSQRLTKIYQEVVSGVKFRKPDAIAFEGGYVGQHPQSALHLGYARGVVLLVAGIYDLLAFEYPPATVKKAVAQSGKATKREVADAVRGIIGGHFSATHPDEADAMAVGITYIKDVSASPLTPTRKPASYPVILPGKETD